VSLAADLKKEFRDIYRYRYVTISYIQTNLKLRYRRSYLGFLWTVLAPILNYLVMGLVFSLIMRSHIENFFAYYFSGAVFFAVVSSILNRSTHFLIGNEHFIKKIYLPKLTFILNGTLYEFTNFALSVVALFFLGAIFQQLHFSIYAPLALIPLALILFFLIGIGSIISVATVYFRDLMHIIPVGVQSLFFLTPILYTQSMIPEKYQFLLKLNPIYYFLECFRHIYI
jgi:ABC-2 type transport system permease protein